MESPEAFLMVMFAVAIALAIVIVFLIMFIQEMGRDGKRKPKR
jgi:hypothetical protein